PASNRRTHSSSACTSSSATRSARTPPWSAKSVRAKSEEKPPRHDQSFALRRRNAMNVNWSECYLRHFAHYFGKPSDAETYRPSEASPPLQLAIYDRGYKNHRVFASVGLTHYAADLKTLGEVIVLSDTAWKEVPFLMVNSLFFLIQKRIPLEPGVTVGGVANLNPDLAEYFDKSALFYMDATGFPPGFDTVACGEEEGRVFQGVFVSESEERFIRNKGASAFEEELHL